MIFLLVVLCLFVVAVAVRMVLVHMRYPQVNTIKVDMGTAYEIDDGLNMEVIKTKYLDNEDLIAAYGADIIENLDVTKTHDMKVIETTVKLTNTSDEEKTLSLTEIRIETDYYQNGLVPELFYAENED